MGWFDEAISNLGGSIKDLSEQGLNAKVNNPLSHVGIGNDTYKAGEVATAAAAGYGAYSLWNYYAASSLGASAGGAAGAEVGASSGTGFWGSSAAAAPAAPAATIAASTPWYQTLATSALGLLGGGKGGGGGAAPAMSFIPPAETNDAVYYDAAGQTKSGAQNTVIYLAIGAAILFVLYKVGKKWM